MKFVEQFAKYQAHRHAEQTRVERRDDTTMCITIGGRSATIPMDRLIVEDDALKAVSAAVDELFGILPGGST